MKHSFGSLFDQATLWSQGIVSTGTRKKHLSSTIIGSNKFKWFHGRLKIYHSKISCNCMYRWWSLIQWHLIYFIGSKDVCKLHDRWKYITTQYFETPPPPQSFVGVSFFCVPASTHVIYFIGVLLNDICSSLSASQYSLDMCFILFPVWGYNDHLQT